MSDQDTQYERFVRNIMQTLVAAQGLDSVVVEHDVQVRGLSRSHQVDVYWEYRLGGVLHRVIINCKRYKASVAVTEVLTLAGVLGDMPGVRGLIVTTVGFQKGAVEYAVLHQIGLKVIRPPREQDWNGRIRQISIHLTLNQPKLIDCSIDLDEEWLKANLMGDPAALTGRVVEDPTRVSIRDLTTGGVDNIHGLWNRAMAENPTNPGTETEKILRWQDARLELPGHPSMRIHQLRLRWRIEPGEPFTTLIRSEPTGIVKDAIEGTLLFIDPDGAITGDVEQELGRKP